MIFSIVTIINNNPYGLESDCCRLQGSYRSDQRSKHCDYCYEYGDNGKRPFKKMWHSCEVIVTNLRVTTLFTYLLSPQSPWEANRFSVSQEIPRILWNRFDKCQSSVRILSQINPVHASTRLPEGYNRIRSVNRKTCLRATHRAYFVSVLLHPLVFLYFEYFVATLARPGVLIEGRGHWLS
jgi:hypothetical protein